MYNLDDYFKNITESDRLVQSYLIGNTTYDEIKLELFDVINKYFFKSSINLDENPDFYVYKCDDGIVSKDDIKELIKNITTTSQFNNAKVYVIDECEKLSDFAYNAILKTLEEPEKGIYALLITKNMDLVKPTIASRCQKIFISSTTTNEFDEQCIELGNKMIEYIETDGIETISNHPEIYNEIEDRKNFLNILKYMLGRYKEELDNIIYNRPSESIIIKNNNVERLSKKIIVINDNIGNLEAYLNKNLSIDRLIIEMSRC